MSSVAIVGGGLSGLSAAYYLFKKIPNLKITLLESSGRLGGWIKSNKKDGILFEQGPRTIRPKGIAGTNTLELISELNLINKIRPIPSSHPAALNRMIYVNNDLHLLPSSIKGLITKQSPFSKPIISYLLNDLMAPQKILKDESIYDFVSRRFNIEVADYLISPLICGICAGNAQQISVRFLMSQLFDYEQQYGNISKGFLRNLFKNNNNSNVNNDLVMKCKNEKWSVYSFDDGCETLPLTLQKELKKNDVNIHVNCILDEIEFKNNRKVYLKAFDKNYEFDHIISAIPADSLGKLLKNQHPKLNNFLSQIPNVSVAVVNLQFNDKLLNQEGFGFLVAPKEKLPILGVIYDSCCFPCNDNTVLTVMMGGYWFKQNFGDNPNKELLLDTALDQIKNILRITDKPIKYEVNILKNCLPQYIVGHYDNVQQIENYIKENNLSISLCGASYYGVGVNDVILSAKKAVDNLQI